MRKIVLCCGRGGCPEAYVLNNEVLIDDDWGNTVRMTKEQFEILHEKHERGEIY